MAKRARKEGQVWEVVNRERRRKRKVNEGIEMKKWVNYFRGLLGGRVERRVVRGIRGNGREVKGKLTKEEMRGAVRRIREGKAVGRDEIPGEV